jgi:hypothetical protein
MDGMGNVRPVGEESFPEVDGVRLSHVAPALGPWSAAFGFRSPARPWVSTKFEMRVSKSETIAESETQDSEALMPSVGSCENGSDSERR